MGNQGLILEREPEKAAAVIPVPIVYLKVAVIEKFVAGSRSQVDEVARCCLS